MGNVSKLALVTGGLRRLGGHIAARLAEKGYTLALHGHSAAVPDKTLLDTLNINDSQWHGFTADFGLVDEPQRLFDAVTQYFGKTPDLLINNASIFEYDNLDSFAQAASERHMRINMIAPAVLTTLMAQNSKDTSGRCVINIVDQRVRNPNGDQLSYTFSKQAMAQSVRTLAIACAPNVRVNGVAPGLTIPTDDYGVAQLDKLTSAMPLERLSSPDDIANAVLYLASAQSVTGQIIFVDGGAQLKSFDRDFIFMEAE